LNIPDIFFPVVSFNNRKFKKNRKTTKTTGNNCAPACNIMTQRLYETDPNNARMLSEHRLALLLDFDDTIVSGTTVNVEGRRLDPDMAVIRTPKYTGVVVGRPHLLDFLGSLVGFYDIYVCTLAEKDYVERALSALIPTWDDFIVRIFSRTTFSGNAKFVPELVGTADMCAILDDRSDVWQGKLARNWIEIAPFSIFAEDGTRVTLKRPDTHLIHCAEKLKKIHEAFYNDPPEPWMSSVIPSVMRSTLMGCVVYVCGTNRDQIALISMAAVSIGARIVDRPCDQVTHVIMLERPADFNDHEVYCPGLVIVSVFWLTTALRKWDRPDDKLFLIKRDCVVPTTSPTPQ
jgi:hypothetical protein